MAHRIFETDENDRAKRDQSGNLVVKKVKDYTDAEREKYEDQLCRKAERDVPHIRDAKLRQFADSL